MLDTERHTKAVRLLTEATRSLLQAAAEMQKKGIDTRPLSRSMEMIAQTLSELTDTTEPPERKS